MTKFIRHAITEVIEVQPAKFDDHRGYFAEVFKQCLFEAEGITASWIQDNQSYSAQVGTVRGLHFQVPPVAQAKLVRVLRGAIFDVAVDIRQGSPTYGQWVGVELSAAKLNQLYVPVGFAHCFMTLEPNTEVLYKVSAPYSREHEGTISWADKDLGIVWPNAEVTPVLSEKDEAAQSFADFQSPFEFQSRD